jgi:hypothetical protein
MKKNEEKNNYFKHYRMLHNLEPSRSKNYMAR